MNASLRTSTNYFIINMAVSDILSSSANWPVYATEGIIIRKPMIEGSVASKVCKLGHYFRAVSLAVSVLSLLQDRAQSCSIDVRLDLVTTDFHPLCIVK